MLKLGRCGDVGGVGGILLPHFLHSPYQHWKGMVSVNVGVSLGQQANRAHCRPIAPLAMFLTAFLESAEWGVCGGVTFI